MTRTDSPTARARADADPALSRRLRQGTERVHASAERAEFLGRLLAGRLGIEAWRMLLEQYEGIYGALETAIAALPENHVCTELFSVELDRSVSIAHDLRALDARLGAGRIGMLPSTRDYVERILSCRHDPHRLLAHHYVRCLGDLSGGQAMRVMLDRAYGLPDAEAAFFRFEEIAAIPPFKQRYRAALDRLALDAAAAARLIDEAVESFEHNERILAELGEIVDAAPAVAAA